MTDRREVAIDEIQVVRMQMFDSTIKQVDHIKNLSHASTRSNAVKTAIQIADTIISSISSGSLIIIENMDGSKLKMTLPGMDYHV